MFASVWKAIYLFFQMEGEWFFLFGPWAGGAARTVRATADRRRRGALGGGAARAVRATAAAAVGPGGGWGASVESP